MTKNNSNWDQIFDKSVEEFIVYRDVLPKDMQQFRSYLKGFAFDVASNVTRELQKKYDAEVMSRAIDNTHN